MEVEQDKRLMELPTIALNSFTNNNKMLENFNLS